MPTFIRVMISSRCNDPIQFGGAASTLSVVRKQLKKELEQIQLFGTQVFEVWINEDAPPAEGAADSWEECLIQVRSADVVLVLYNGNAGWAKQGGDVGICHAELEMALATGAAKARLIELPLSPVGAGHTRSRNERFRDYVRTQSLFRGAAAADGEQAMVRCRQALREAVVALTKLGVREARRGRYSTGDALEWHRLDYNGRRKAMRDALTGTLSARDGAQLLNNYRVLVRIANRNVLVACHAVPDAFTIPSALDTVGQRFRNDHLEVPHLVGQIVGPVHVFACHQGVTAAQARKFLGFPDATIVQSPFGIYVADPVQMIQLAFMSQCRDDTCVRHGIQRFFDWLEQTGEDARLADRAQSRKRIVTAIAKEVEPEQ